MVTQAEKLTIWIQFEITRPVAAIKSLRFALLFLQRQIEHKTAYEVEQADKKFIFITFWKKNSSHQGICGLLEICHTRMVGMPFAEFKEWPF